MEYDFTGKYDHQLDEKRRIRIPSKLKGALENGYSLCVGPDRCIWVIPPETKKRIEDNFRRTSGKDVLARAAKRKVFSSIYTPEEDKQGRILLPMELAKYAGITKDVVFVGMGNYIELWSAETFYRYDEEVEVDIGQYLDPDSGSDEV